MGDGDAQLMRAEQCTGIPHHIQATARWVELLGESAVRIQQKAEQQFIAAQEAQQL